MDKLKDLSGYIANFIEQLIHFLPTLIGAIVLLCVGWWVINVVVRRFRKILEKRSHDPALQGFLTSLTKIVLRILLIVIVISQLGVETASLIAMLGAAGLAVGLALQGSLANFAGGVIILALRPFRTGDWIEAQGVSGTVTEISLFYTKLTTAGNQLAVIPNAQISNEKIVNYTVLGRRKDFLTFGISYNSDIGKAKEILLKIMMEQKNILKDPAPEVIVDGLGDNAVNLSARFWADNNNFWECHWYTIEEAKTRLEDAGIQLPFPQRELHIISGEKDGNNSGKETFEGK